jgi:DNA-binding transcriptional MerR regulator
MNDGTFKALTVAKLAGLPLRTLANWVDYGLATCAHNVKGTGRVRRFDFADLVRLFAIIRLRNAGLSMQALRRAVAILQAEYQEGDPLGSGRLLVIGDRPFWLQGDDELVDLLRRQTAMQNVILVDLGQVAQETRAKVQALAA